MDNGTDAAVTYADATSLPPSRYLARKNIELEKGFDYEVEIVAGQPANRFVSGRFAWSLDNVPGSNPARPSNDAAEKPFFFYRVDDTNDASVPKGWYVSNEGGRLHFPGSGE